MNSQNEKPIGDRAAISKLPLPVASVLMLAYNHGPYIRQSIESILQQKTTFPFELIIGEDCSTDDTRSIVLEYEQKYPHIIRAITSEKNVGGWENCYRVEQACRGQYVTYCEGDDYWHDPGKLQQQVAFLESHLDYAMVHSDFRTYHVASGKMAPRSLGLCGNLDDADAFNDLLSGRRIVLTLTACIRRSVWEAVLRECPECYDPRFLMGDTQRWLEIARRGKVKYFPGILATRQLLPESATQSMDHSRVIRFSRSAKDVLDYYMEKYGCSPEARKAAQTRSAIQLLSCAYAAGDAALANTALAEYSKVGARVPFQARLYYFGSQSPVWAKLVRPLLALAVFGEKAWRRAADMFKSER